MSNQSCNTPIPGDLCIFQTYSHIFAEESEESEILGTLNPGSIVIFVGVSDTAPDSSQFIRVIVGELCGYVYVFWNPETPFYLCDFLEKLQSRRNMIELCCNP